MPKRIRRASLCSMDLIEGARILAARIANATPADDREAKQWSPHALPARDSRCISCNG